MAALNPVRSREAPRVLVRVRDSPYRDFLSPDRNGPVRPPDSPRTRPPGNTPPTSACTMCLCRGTHSGRLGPWLVACRSRRFQRNNRGCSSSYRPSRSTRMYHCRFGFASSFPRTRTLRLVRPCRSDGSPGQRNFRTRTMGSTCKTRSTCVGAAAFRSLRTSLVSHRSFQTHTRPSGPCTGPRHLRAPRRGFLRPRRSAPRPSLPRPLRRRAAHFRPRRQWWMAYHWFLQSANAPRARLLTRRLRRRHLPFRADAGHCRVGRCTPPRTASRRRRARACRSGSCVGVQVIAAAISRRPGGAGLPPDSSSVGPPASSRTTAPYSRIDCRTRRFAQAPASILT
jgi:hypothetical protein